MERELYSKVAVQARATRGRQGKQGRSVVRRGEESRARRSERVTMVKERREKQQLVWNFVMSEDRFLVSPQLFQLSHCPPLNVFP